MMSRSPVDVQDQDPTIAWPSRPCARRRSAARLEPLDRQVPQVERPSGVQLNGVADAVSEGDAGSSIGRAGSASGCRHPARAGAVSCGRQVLDRRADGRFPQRLLARELEGVLDEHELHGQAGVVRLRDLDVVPRPAVGHGELDGEGEVPDEAGRCTSQRRGILATSRPGVRPPDSVDESSLGPGLWLPDGPPVPDGARGQQAPADDGDDEHGRDGGPDLERWIHGAIPPGQTPCGSLVLEGDALGDDVDHAVGHRRRAIVEPVVEDELDVGAFAHDGAPPTATARASASRAARMARWA